MDTINKEFITALHSLEDKKCWGFTAGYGTESVVNFQFGKKIKRSKPLHNPQILEDQRNYEAELSLSVMCAWRLDTNGKIICGSGDSNVKGGLMLTGLADLINKKVTSVSPYPPSFDLELVFENGFQLRVFCDQVRNDDDENYSFYTPRLVYTVNARSILTREARE